MWVAPPPLPAILFVLVLLYPSPPPLYPPLAVCLAAVVVTSPWPPTFIYNVWPSVRYAYPLE